MNQNLELNNDNDNKEDYTNKNHLSKLLDNGEGQKNTAKNS